MARPAIRGSAAGRMGSENFIPLTLDEHRELALELKSTTHRLRALCDLIVNVYGPHNKAAFSFLKALDALDRLNEDLETQAAEDLQGQSTDGFHR